MRVESAYFLICWLVYTRLHSPTHMCPCLRMWAEDDAISEISFDKKINRCLVHFLYELWALVKIELHNYRVAFFCKTGWQKGNETKPWPNNIASSFSETNFIVLHSHKMYLVSALNNHITKFHFKSWDASHDKRSQ